MLAALLGIAMAVPARSATTVQVTGGQVAGVVVPLPDEHPHAEPAAFAAALQFLDIFLRHRSQ